MKQHFLVFNTPLAKMDLPEESLNNSLNTEPPGTPTLKKTLLKPTQGLFLKSSSEKKKKKLKRDTKREKSLNSGRNKENLHTLLKNKESTTIQRQIAIRPLYLNNLSKITAFPPFDKKSMEKVSRKREIAIPKPRT